MLIAKEPSHLKTVAQTLFVSHMNKYLAEIFSVVQRIPYYIHDCFKKASSAQVRQPRAKWARTQRSRGTQENLQLSHSVA